MSFLWSRLLIILIPILLSSCGSHMAPQQASQNTDAVEMKKPLRSFSQDIQSSVKSLQLKPSEETLLPVTVRNTGDTAWSSAGNFPLTVSYKWFDGDNILPIEVNGRYCQQPSSRMNPFRCK